MYYRSQGKSAGSVVDCQIFILLWDSKPSSSLSAREPGAVCIVSFAVDFMRNYCKISHMKTNKYKHIIN
jgi:hypothetical protein